MQASMAKDSIEQRDGNYYVAATRISLESIVHAFRRGESPETGVHFFASAVKSVAQTRRQRSSGALSLGPLVALASQAGVNVSLESSPRALSRFPDG